MRYRAVLVPVLVGVLTLVALATPSASEAAGGTITTVAGGGAGDGGPATSAAFYQPESVAADGGGNLYIADFCSIRKVSGGTITTVAGTAGGCSYFGDGGLATSAALGTLRGIAVDAGGDLYIADNSNCRIRKVSAGTITTVAGTGVCDYSGDGGDPTSAALRYPRGVAVDGGGNLYIADSGNCRIRKVSAGTITTVAGTGACGYSGDGGLAISAAIGQTASLTTDGIGNLYITDACRIRMVSGGTITTVVGSGVCGSSGDGGPAASAALDRPQSVVMDAGGNLYLAEFDSCKVRKVSGGTIITAAGNSSCAYSGDGGASTSAALRDPRGVAVDGSGDLYIADTFNCRIREVSGGTITTVAGGPCGYSGDGGAATSAALSAPSSVAVDGGGNLYIADSGNCRIRMVSGGTITTVAGVGSCGYGGDGGAPASAALYKPRGVAVDGDGNLYIADTINCRIRKVSGGMITTVAGTGACGYGGDGGAATSAVLNRPESVAVDGDGNLYIADARNCRIRKVSGGTIQTVGGDGTCGYSFGGLQGVSVDGTGNLYIPDAGKCRIRKVSGSTITTVAGLGSCGYSGDGGAATSALLYNAYGGVAVDSGGNVYIPDFGNCRIRKVSGGTITTIAGTGVCYYSGEGVSATIASLSYPNNVALDGAGNLYIAELGSNRIRRVSASVVGGISVRPEIAGLPPAGRASHSPSFEWAAASAAGVALALAFAAGVVAIRRKRAA